EAPLIGGGEQRRQRLAQQERVAPLPLLRRRGDRRAVTGLAVERRCLLAPAGEEPIENVGEEAEGRAGGAALRPDDEKAERGLEEEEGGGHDRPHGGRSVRPVLADDVGDRNGQQRELAHQRTL